MSPANVAYDAQVRTAHMHADAEGGTASHSLYKGSLENPEEASLFRSKMAPNVLSPAHRLSAKSESREAKAKAKAVMTGSSPGNVPLPDAPGKDGAAAAAAAVLDVETGDVDSHGGGPCTPGLEGSN